MQKKRETGKEDYILKRLIFLCGPRMRATPLVSALEEGEKGMTCFRWIEKVVSVSGLVFKCSLNVVPQKLGRQLSWKPRKNKELGLSRLEDSDNSPRELWDLLFFKNVIV